MRSVIISNQQFQITDYKLSVITDFKVGVVSISNYQYVEDSKSLISKRGFVRQMKAAGSTQK
jgi:hypothetical protein